MNALTQAWQQGNALVVGASQGIGLGFVQHLLADDRFHQVFATYRQPATATDLLALQNHPKLSVYAGLSLGYLLTTYAEEQTTAYQGGNIEETNREVFGRRRLAYDWQIGGITGLAWQLTPRWTADLRYYLGNRPGQTQGPAGERQPLPRQQYLQLGLGYRLFRLERIRTR